MIDIGIFRAQKAAVMRRWRQTAKGRATTLRYQHSSKRKAAQLKYQRALRVECALAYSGKCQCSCGCQDSRIEILEFAHINGDGKAHREELGSCGPYAFYLWLKRNNFPKNRIVLLCPSCHAAKDILGECKKSP